VQVTLTNAGVEQHQATILRLNDGVDAGAFAAAGSSDPTGAAALELVTAYGGPNAVAPGTVNATTQVLDKPGSYLFVCFIAGADGVPHIAKGMIQQINVG